METPHVTKRQLLLGCVVFGVIGAACMAFLNWPILLEDGVYNGDLTQSPHWVAYHGDSFAPDDLLVEYGSYNESPVQNVLYWVGTLFIDLTLLNKLMGIALFGLTAALFFWLVSLMEGPRAGALAALFFSVFPRSAYEISGGFSKSWAIGFVLASVYVLESRRWAILLWTMPLAALAYPVSPVLMGATVAVGLVLELRRSRAEAIRGLKYLVGASSLALVPLLTKYFFVSRPRIGEMFSPEVMREMWDKGESTSVTLPLWEEVLSYLSYPFFIYGTIALLMLAWRRQPVWRQGWTALVVASTVLYYVSDLVVPQLYLPDRYSRFSVAVLVVLWHATNWDRVLRVFDTPWLHRAAVGGLMALTVVSLSETFRPGDGGDTLQRWRDRRFCAPISRAIALQPEPVLVAGHPYFLGDVLVQAQRPVLVVHRMFHAWYDAYREEIDNRVKDSFRAIYAQDAATVNLLAERYGVTHLVVPKVFFNRPRLLRGRVYRKYFEPFIVEITRGKSFFLLENPPRESVLFEDVTFWLVKLPLETPGRSGNVPEDQVPDPAGQRQR